MATKKRGAQAKDGQSKRAVRDRERRAKDPKLTNVQRGEALEIGARMKIRRAVKRRVARAGQAMPPPDETDGTVVQSYQAWAKKRSKREGYVDEVVQQMAHGSWLPGVSCRLLAERWDCTPALVESVAAEAARVIRRTLREDDETFLADARVEVLQTFRAIRARAIAMSGRPDFQPSAQVAALNVAMQATRLYGHYLGLEPEQGAARKVGTADFADWTTEELDAFANRGERPARLKPSA